MTKTILTLAVIFLHIGSYGQPLIDKVRNGFYHQKFTEEPINIFELKWIPNSHDFWVSNDQGVFVYNADNLSEKKLVLSAQRISASGLSTVIENIVWSDDRSKILIYTNSTKVWRAKSKGDYWYFNLSGGKGRQLGKGLAASSLQFAKFSPDNRKVAYVSKHNLFEEEISSGTILKLTSDGKDKIINGTFDWVYEEELGIRDGFSWSPDGNNIAYWHTDATATKNYLMINNTDSLYPFIKPVEYPIAGEKPSLVKIGVVNLTSKKTTWMHVPGDPSDHYIPRMNWASNREVMIMQLNRLQNQGLFYLCNAETGNAKMFYSEKVEGGWIEPFNMLDWDAPWWVWSKDRKYFLRTEEKQGWLRVCKISLDGKEELLTKGNFDANLMTYDDESGDVYFEATPYDATQRYLYKVNINHADTVRVTPAVFDGTNVYSFSPDAKYALHINANIHRNYNLRLIHLPEHNKVYPNREDIFTEPNLGFRLEKLRVKTEDGIEMDGIMAKPNDFDPSKKYPVFFFVYGEPASAVANDVPYFNELIADLIPRGYIGVALDNRGTPVMKGTDWRMSIYKKIGVINSRDQAMAAKEILKLNFIDSTRVAVHGWSGGGAMTLNLMFRYPDIYKTGIAVSAVTDQRFYDNIYTERYMGLPQDDSDAYKQSSPLTFAKYLKGNLLYMHGTGDDNVHYKNAEQLINELIRDAKVFQLMVYPNRTHEISEGAGTTEQLAATFRKFIEEHAPPGGR